MSLSFIIAVWAAAWVVVSAGIALIGFRRRRLLQAAAWLISIGAFLAVQEDPLLVLQFTSSAPDNGFNRDAVLGLVQSHTRGHMYGAAVLAVAGIGLAVVVAHTALRRGERWAWWALLGFWLLGAAVNAYEVFWIFPHDFPLAPTPADGRRGFGWQTIAAWIVIWALGLVVAARTVFAREQARGIAVPRRA